MKKNLLTVLILALLVVNLVLTAIMMVSVIGVNKKTSALVSNISTALNLDLRVPGEDTGADVPIADTVVHSLGEVAIPLASTDGSQPYIIFNLALSMNSKHKDYKEYGESIADWEAIIQDRVTSVVSVHTIEECQPDKIENIKAEILQAIQEQFNSDFIFKVSISGIKFG